MMYKILVLIALIASVLLSGCLENQKDNDENNRSGIVMTSPTNETACIEANNNGNFTTKEIIKNNTIDNTSAFFVPNLTISAPRDYFVVVKNNDIEWVKIVSNNSSYAQFKIIINKSYINNISNESDKMIIDIDNNIDGMIE